MKLGVSGKGSFTHDRVPTRTCISITGVQTRRSMGLLALMRLDL